MTFMSFLLLIILFLVFFIYFSGLNPHEITIAYLPGHEVSYSVTLVVVGCVLLGLILGYTAHLYGVFTHLMKHWKHDRTEKKVREVSAIYREGVGRLLSGDVKKARGLLQKALERDPSRVDTYIAMASVHLQEGNAQDGLNLLRKARDIDPKSLEVLFKLAAAHEEIGDDDEAVQAYREILGIESNNRKALRSLRDLHIRHERWPEALEQQKRVLKAGTAGNRLEEEKKKQLYLRYEAARATLEGGEAEKAESELKDIADKAPEFAPARVSLGDACRALGRAAEADRVWQEGYRKLGKSIFLSRLEDLYMEAQDPSTLLAFYRSALLEKTDDLLLRLFYGKLCLRLEMVDEALEQLDAVESAGVESPQLHLLLGEAHRRRNRIDEAIDEYKKALGIDSRLRLGYLCEACGESTAEWSSRCPACGAWDRASLADRQVFRNARPVEARPIHHGER